MADNPGCFMFSDGRKVDGISVEQALRDSITEATSLLMDGMRKIDLRSIRAVATTIAMTQEDPTDGGDDDATEYEVRVDEGYSWVTVYAGDSLAGARDYATNCLLSGAEWRIVMIEPKILEEGSVP